MSVDYTGFAFPKGPTRLETKATKDKADTKALEVFRKAVWLRDKGKCRICGYKVLKTVALHPKRGEVHHLRGRNVTPEDRYDVSKALLLCAKDHERAQKHQVKVPKP